jgi:hypothetical protein
MSRIVDEKTFSFQLSPSRFYVVVGESSVIEQDASRSKLTSEQVQTYKYGNASVRTSHRSSITRTLRHTFTYYKIFTAQQASCLLHPFRYSPYILAAGLF